MKLITKQGIENAMAVIGGYIINTPVTLSHTLSDICGCRTFFKLENMQMTGAFKERGALNKLLSLSDNQKSQGVIAASAGNHAQGIAFHAKRLGVPATIVMPSGTPLIKVSSTQRDGADVVLHGETYDDAQDHAADLAKHQSLTLIHPFEDPLVIAGQGTIAIEILENKVCDTIDAIVVPIGGGGLISGIATYVKETRPEIKVIGVEAEACPAMKKSIKSGKLTQLKDAHSLADGIAVKRVGQINLEIVKKYVDEIVTVSEDEIANAILLLLEIEKIAVEGAGAVSLAALVNRKISINAKNVLSIVSGGNIDVNILNRIITRGLNVDGRIMKFDIRLEDSPGTLSALLNIIKDHNSNILDISHHRFDSSARFGYVDVSLTLETKGHKHVNEVRDALVRNGYELKDYVAVAASD